MESKSKKKIEQKEYRATATLDPRCKLIQLILIGFVSYFVNCDIAGILLICVLGVYISFGNGCKWALKMFICYIAVSILNSLFRYITVPGFSVIVTVFGVTVIKMIPIVMLGRWILITTYMDDLTVALQRAKMPQSVIISLVVMFRYIPTLGIEYRMIRNTMRIRGICDTIPKCILHPIASIEYILVPLLMRCLKVTDELAASGTTRGLERENIRYSLNEVRFSEKDYFVIGATVAILCMLILIDNSALSNISLWRFL